MNEMLMSQLLTSYIEFVYSHGRFPTYTCRSCKFFKKGADVCNTCTVAGSFKSIEEFTGAVKVANP